MSRSQQPPPPIPRFDAETAQRFLSQILDTSAGICEIRIFKAGFERGYVVAKDQYSATLAGWYDSIHEMIADLGKLKGVSGYITINPVHPDLFARSANRLTKQRHTTTDDDIVIFRWLYIDVDPRRPAEISATDAELAAAVDVRDRILADHPTLTNSAIWGKSGNGGWILVMLPDYLPEEGRELANQALAWIAKEYSNEAVKIDVSTKNPSRVGVIPGTAKCKGSHVANRPHRLATLDSPDRGPDDPLLPCDLVAWIAAVGAEQAAQPVAASQRKGKNSGRELARTARGEVDRLYRAGAYLDRMAPAISGQGGHGQTFDAACSLIHGFGLEMDEARPLLHTYNRRCQPPWSDAELEHKLSEAASKLDPRPRGYLLDAGRPERNGETTAGSGGSEGDGPADEDKRRSAVVDIVPTEILVNSDVCTLLPHHDGLYQRNYRLVEVARLPREESRKRVGVLQAGMPMTVTIEGPRLREIISGVASFRVNGKPAHPPDWCVSAILHRRYWHGLPVLGGVVEHPVLRPDGSISANSGYDEETGMLCIGEETFLAVPENPTRDEAAEAAGRLLAVVEEFPFQGRPHMAAWLACLLTVLNRHLIDGPVPLFLVEATLSGTGKTLLCDLISRIATGRDMVRGAYYHDAIEMDKRIVSAALEGIRITMLDNVEGSFGNSSLDNALTGRWYQGRVLGQSAMTAPLLLDSVFVATGNNINFVGDIFRRIVLCRLESPLERPDKDRTVYKIADIGQHVLDHRDELLRDAMTIMRAYLQAGCPHTLPTNVYPHWTRLIRGAIQWCTAIDPMENDHEIVEADLARMSRAGLIEGLVEMMRYLGIYGITGGQILNTLQEEMYRDRFHAIRDAIANFWSNGKLPGPGALGRKLMSMRGTRAGHFRLAKIDMNKHTAIWGVQHWDNDTEQWTTVSNWPDVEHLFGEGN